MEIIYCVFNGCQIITRQCTFLVYPCRPTCTVYAIINPVKEPHIILFSHKHVYFYV